MKKSIFIFLMLGAAVFAGNSAFAMDAQNQSHQPTVMAVCEPISKPFLFEIEAQGKKSLLLGSVHSIKLDRFPPYAREKLKSAQSLVVECIRNFKAMTKEQLLECGALRDPNSQSWIDQLKPHLRAHLEEKLTPKIQRYHPGIKVGDLSLIAALLKYDSPDNNEGMDSQLQHMHNPSMVFALEEVKSVHKLMESTFGLSKLQEILEADYIAKQRGEEEESDYANRWIEHHYINGLLYELKDFFETSSKRDSDTTNIMRNNIWLSKIEEYHLNNLSPVLIVVGLSHLLGEMGLLNLLQNKGFSIRQITPDGSFKFIDINEFK